VFGTVHLRCGHTSENGFSSAESSHGPRLRRTHTLVLAGLVA